MSVTGTDTRTTHAVKRIVLHELITIDNNYKEHLRRFFNVGMNWFTGCSAATPSRSRRTRRRRRRPPSRSRRRSPPPRRAS